MLICDVVGHILAGHPQDQFPLTTHSITLTMLHRTSRLYTMSHKNVIIIVIVKTICSVHKVNA